MGNKTTALATLAANIKQGIDVRIKDLHTSMPGIIESFDPVTQLASVQPAIKRIFKTDTGEKEILIPSPLPILINVLIQFPRGGGFSLTFPVKKGDECLLVFCERSIDNWHKFSGVKEPGAKRFHALSDATAFVGLSSIPNKVPDYDGTNTQLKKDDGSVYITLKNNSDMDLHADGNINATCTDANITASGECNITATTINITGKLNIIGDTDINGYLKNNTKFVGSTHTHAQGNDSNGDSEQETEVPS